VRKFTITIRAAVTVQATYKWETEEVEGITPTDSLDVVAQLWEQTHLTDLDHHFRFYLPKSNTRPIKVYWDSKRLAHTSERELDLMETRWWREAGEPLAWLQGVGPEATFEVFEIQTDYNQSYELQGFDQGGMPRLYSSDDAANRQYETDSPVQTWDYGYTSSPDSGMIPGFGLRITVVISDLDSDALGVFSWEADTTVDSDEALDFVGTAAWELDVEIGVGVGRRILSTDRQYLGTAYDSGQDLLGIPRSFGSSENALTVWQAITPTRALTESDVPDLIHSQLHKFIRFYVLNKALSRPGEGYRPDLAQHYAGLYQLGVGLLAVLGTPSILDRVYAREQTKDASIQAPPRVRLPSTFEKVF
jgi:hypothetical protein